MKKNLFNGKYVEQYKIWFLLPLIVVLIGFIVFSGFAIKSCVDNKNAGMSNGEAVSGGINDGFNIGIDFEGGTILNVVLGKDLTDANFKEHSNRLSDIVKKNGLKVSYAQRSDSDENARVVLKFEAASEEQSRAITEAILSNDAYAGKVSQSDVTFKTISATASKDLVWTAVVSIIVSTVLILIYVIIRFEFWSAISAVLALMHDVLMMLCLTVIFRVPINSSFIAAIITIVAYSINATIVLFDRVRENYKLVKPTSDLRDYNRAICNKSIKETFIRNINTTVTTLVAIVVLAIIGDVSIREFAMPVIFGLVVGCYSSMVISPSIFCLLKNRFSKATRDAAKADIAAKKAAKLANKKTADVENA